MFCFRLFIRFAQTRNTRNSHNSVAEPGEAFRKLIIEQGHFDMEALEKTTFMLIGLHRVRSQSVPHS